MRNFSIDIVWAKIQMAISAVGGWLGYFVGGVDGLMTALIIFMVIDYITGLMCAVADRKLSSAVGFKGICKKVLIILLVGVAHIVDLHVVGIGSALRSAVVCFYLSNGEPAGECRTLGSAHSREAEGHPVPAARARGSEGRCEGG